jgi:hypothetical protein
MPELAIAGNRKFYCQKNNNIVTVILRKRVRIRFLLP